MRPDDETQAAALARHAVTFTKEDGRSPTRAHPSRSFNLRSPIPIRLPAGQVVRIDLGISCDHPLLVFPARSMNERGLVLHVASPVFDAGERVNVQVSNATGEDTFIEEGETVCRAHALTDAWSEDL